MLTCGVLWLFQQLRLLDQVKAQPFAARHVVGSASDLNQATATKLRTVARLVVAQITTSLVAGLRFGWPPDLFHIPELARFMTDLGDERCNSLRANDLVPHHRGV